jgi:hypothetical protein
VRHYNLTGRLGIRTSDIGHRREMSSARDTCYILLYFSCSVRSLSRSESRADSSLISVYFHDGVLSCGNASNHKFLIPLQVGVLRHSHLFPVPFMNGTGSKCTSHIGSVSHSTSTRTREREFQRYSWENRCR